MTTQLEVMMKATGEIPTHRTHNTGISSSLYKGHKAPWPKLTARPQRGSFPWPGFSQDAMELLPLLLAGSLLFTVAAPARDITSVCASQIRGTYKFLLQLKCAGNHFDTMSVTLNHFVNNQINCVRLQIQYIIERQNQIYPTSYTAQSRFIRWQVLLNLTNHDKFFKENSDDSLTDMKRNFLLFILSRYKSSSLQSPIFVLEHSQGLQQPSSCQ